MPQDAHNSQVFSDIAAAACVGLMADYGVALAPISAQAEAASCPLPVVGIIGFTSESGRGTLVLGISQEPLRRSNPVRGQSEADWSWVAELTNQLLGRIKAELTARGIIIYLAIQTVMRGERMAPVPRQPLHPLVFSTGDGLVCTWFDADWNEGCVLPDEPTESDTRMDAGEMMMF
jgi:hypothetical protein